MLKLNKIQIVGLVLGIIYFLICIYQVYWIQNYSYKTTFTSGDGRFVLLIMVIKHFLNSLIGTSLWLSVFDSKNKYTIIQKIGYYIGLFFIFHFSFLIINDIYFSIVHYYTVYFGSHYEFPFLKIFNQLLKIISVLFCTWLWLFVFKNKKIKVSV